MNESFSSCAVANSPASEEWNRPNGLHGRRVALYSHDTMGIGHMRRNILIAQTLASPPLSATVLLIAGAREASAFALPPNVDCLTLPAFGKTAEGKYRARALGVSLRELVALRADTIASALRAFAPDALVVDKEPRGALGELGPALEQLRSRSHTRCVLGLRDVLDDPVTVRREWCDSDNEAAIRDFYRAVWVYGDRAVYDLVDEYSLGPEVSAMVSFTGYLDPCARLRNSQSVSQPIPADDELPPDPFMLCMVGGGQDGARLAESFAAAQLPHGANSVIITGPYMPPDAQQRIRNLAATNHRIHVREFVAEPCRLVQRAERVVAMGGYNSVSEVLGFEKRALIVPRVSPRQEQLIRAKRLNDMGLIDCLHPNDVNSDAITNWLARDMSPAAPVRSRVDMNGIGRLPDLFRSVLAGAAASKADSSRSVETTHAGR